MKKVIEGKVYNTETATLIHEWDNGMYGSDFKRCEESLYRTAKGAYFTAGSGGPMSKYAVPVGSNGHGGGEGIEILTKKEALAWLESHGGDDAIEEHFSDMIEDA
jgi:hypothetical protein